MKKLLIITGLIITGCNTQEQTTQDRHEEIEKVVTRHVEERTYVFEKKCEGHIYVVGTNSGTQSGVFLLHSPNCPCLKHEGNE